MSEASDRIRRDFKAADDKRDAGLRTPENVIRYDDISYGAEKGWQVLDVYRPRGNGENKVKPDKLPVIFSVHGGGWVYGDKERYQYYCMSLAQRGFAVVNFTYRLAPEFQFPACLEDTNLVVDWMVQHKEEYGLDVHNLFGVGDSAGAHILGLYAALVTDEDYARNYFFKKPEGFCLRAVALNCGKFNMTPEDRDDELMKDFLPLGGTTEEYELINVIKHVHPGYPPVLLMTSNGDFLKEEASLMQKKLVEEGIPHRLMFFGSKEHVLYHVFHCDMRSGDAKKCNDLECAFFKEFVETL